MNSPLTKSILMEKSANGNRRAKCKTNCLLDDSLVILSVSKAFSYFCSRGEFFKNIIVKDRKGDSNCYIFLKRYSTKYLLKLRVGLNLFWKRFFKVCDICNPATTI